MTGRKSPVGRRVLSALLLALEAGGAQARAAPIAVEDAPREWVVYAEAATRVITARLNADGDPSAERVRRALDARRAAPDQVAPPLVLRVWVGRDGVISNVGFEPLEDDAASHALRRLVMQDRLPPPPRRMRLPMRIAVQPQPK
jgi:hypothetical protein